MNDNKMMQTFSIGEATKILQFPGGEYKFFDWLRSKGYLLMDNSPAQMYIDRGWLKYMTTNLSFVKNKTIVPITRITVKGLAGLYKVVEKEFPICKPCNEEK